MKNPPPEWIDEAMENNPDKEDLWEKAVEWLERNPEAYAVIEQAALARAKQGAFSINQLFNNLRFRLAKIGERDPRGFKLNNNLAPYVSRQLVEDHPELLGLIRFRKVRYGPDAKQTGEGQ